MLPKKHRLPREKFNEIFKKGRRIRERYFNLLFLKREDNNPSQVGIVVNKKSFPQAIDRNKIKRQIRNIIIQDILSCLPTGLDIIILVYPIR